MRSTLNQIFWFHAGATSETYRFGGYKHFWRDIPKHDTIKMFSSAINFSSKFEVYVAEILRMK